MYLVTKDDNSIRVGQDVVFRSNMTVHPEAKYKGTVIQVTPRLITIESKVMQDTMREKNMVLGEQTVPVKYSINKNDLGVDTLLWID